MKLNNKGFAITAVLYGLLILFVILVSAFLLVQSAKKDRVDSLIENIENTYRKNISHCTNQSLFDCISNMYNKCEKKIVVNNNIEYNYAEVVSLMNDRLGGVTSDYNAGNIRYYGASPNNYIYFNCDDYNNQTSSSCEKWRIIGIIDGKVKIIKEILLGDFKWNENQTNNWSQATLKDYLNGIYLSEMQTKNSKTPSLISENIWYLQGTNNLTSVYSNNAYAIERNDNGKVYGSNPTTWNGKIALIYISDYGYATDFTVCSEIITKYNNSSDSYGCRKNNWLYSKKNEWTLMQITNDITKVRGIGSQGDTGPGTVNLTNGVRPSLYLDNEVIIKSGNGSSINPYQISV